MTTSVSLADIASHFATLEMRCTRCDHQGRFGVSRLIDKYGKSARLPDLRAALVLSCDHANGHDYDRCDVLFPQLLGATG
jgi:hypothetical protein